LNLSILKEGEFVKKVELKCDRLNERGQGVGQYGRETFEIPNFLPKEVGIFSFDEDKKYQKFKLIKILKTSPMRTEVKCDVFNLCGGCQLLHMKYDDQIAFKQRIVEECFKKGKLPFKIDTIIPAKKQTAYRNKMQVAYKYREGKIVYGFYEEESHRIIHLNHCLVQSERQNEIVKYVQQIMQQLKLSPYNEDKRTGLIRFVLVREAHVTGEVMVIVVTNGDIFPSRSEFVKRLKDNFPYITTIIQNINNRKTSIILGEEERILFGKGYIEDYLLGIKFKISSKAFFQINPEQTEKLYQKVEEYASLTGTEVVLDAYSGVGTIGMVLAKKAKQVIGVESSKQAVSNASANAYENKIRNIKFYCHDATEFLKQMVKDNVGIDVLIMDPPRSGSTTEFLNAILSLKPQKVIYVSCDPTTLVRDLKVLEGAYKIENKTIVDMFVGTYHVETIVSMSLNRN